ncbi:cytochrome P450 monooxygenase [Colletotrichum limetticola]|uniref:Cytochrome P450 monooxygenase n=1 Tax=Colletotrichum limetticola TaxID=1209924 RepID=A0ABQ9PPG8_9PEZI|nr:cytochrome P450 monooxygenase [Colletotrichum limetticola]
MIKHLYHAASIVLQSPIPALILLTSTLLYYIYLKGFPRPLTGIPYNESALKSFLGDLPAFQHARNHGKGFTVWMRDLAQKHRSPIVQVFLGPFTPPCVVLFDYRESYDIVARRTKEFDRCRRDAETMSTILPEHHLSMVSTDARFKGNKDLVKDLMAPGFLNEVSAPEIYSKALSLIELWNVKSKWAAGRPFEAHHDLQNAALDIIMSAAFGKTSNGGVLRQHILQETGYRPFLVPKDLKEPACFKSLGLPTEYQATVDITHFMGRVVTSPFPKQFAWLLKTFTSVSSVFVKKDYFIRSQIQKAVASLSDKWLQGEKAAKSALDFIVLREVTAAKKSGRKPSFTSKRLEDELLGYIVAGHETSASILSWAVKFLADNQKQQHTLRKHLQAVYPAAVKEKRQPSVTELTKVAAPYLDAFLEEILRLSRTASILTREAVTDTIVMGKFVPKGTTIFIFTQGASYVQPPLGVDEQVRSRTSQEAKRVPDWLSDNVGKFCAGRWLVPKTGASGFSEESVGKEDGWTLSDYDFDPQAGPILTFGGGPRGCFGRRLAYLELRMVLALLVWNFAFNPCADNLSTYELRESITVEPKDCYVNLQTSDNM